MKPNLEEKETFTVECDKGQHPYVVGIVGIRKLENPDGSPKGIDLRHCMARIDAYSREQAKKDILAVFVESSPDHVVASVTVKSILRGHEPIFERTSGQTGTL